VIGASVSLIKLTKAPLVMFSPFNFPTNWVLVGLDPFFQFGV